MSILAMITAFSLVLVALAVCRRQGLGLERDILVGAGRATCQLLAMGLVLRYIFALDDWRWTTAMLAGMITIAGANAARRGEGIPKARAIATFGIGLGAGATLLILLLLDIITYRPSDVIPISGMIVGNAMVASGLVLDRLRGEMESRQREILQALALGATGRQAVDSILKASIKAGMIPTIDWMRTLGIVQLPGMMTGLILAGVSPLEAVRYQVVVAFMLTSAVVLSSVTVGLLSCRQLFTPCHQLRGLASSGR